MVTSNEPAHILLVDDEEIVTRFFQITLIRLGYRVSCFQDPAAALESLNSVTEGYDLVICDYMMPGLDGFDFAKAVREQDLDIPIILTTGYGSEQIDRYNAAESGIAECLFKPVKMAELDAAINRVLIDK